MSVENLQFLKEWLVEHIPGQEAKVGHFLRTRAA